MKKILLSLIILITTAVISNFINIKFIVGGYYLLFLIICFKCYKKDRKPYLSIIQDNFIFIIIFNFSVIYPMFVEFINQNLMYNYIDYIYIFLWIVIYSIITIISVLSIRVALLFLTGKGGS